MFITGSEFFTKYRGFAISSHGWKNIKEWKINEFVVPKNDDSTILCPLRAYQSYAEGSRSMGIDLSKGYLFRTLDDSRSMVTEDPVSPSTTFMRLKYYLRLLNIDEGETPHGIRGTCASSLALSGVATEDIMGHVGWSSDLTYKRYSRIGKMLGSERSALKWQDKLRTIIQRKFFIIWGFDYLYLRLGSIMFVKCLLNNASLYMMSEY